MINYEVNDLQNIYSISTQDITFALTEKCKESVCGYTVFKNSKLHLE